MRQAEYGFQNLEVWKLGMSLVKSVYALTKSFPNEEKFALGSQLRRAIISVPLNLAEGSSRGRSKKDFASFVRIAMGSLMEVVTCLEIALSQKYISEAQHQELDALIRELYFKLIGLDKYLVKK